ncbi:MAG: hypothetical protein QME16_06470, partial [Planctomycetota bacterium]|nr:hypothetical protein [Planctomycetota bacterium]
MKSVVPFLRLVRLPNIFTVLSNIWTGSFIATDGMPEFSGVVFASVAGVTLYAGGVALNDYCDRTADGLLLLVGAERPTGSPCGQLTSSYGGSIG